MREADAPVPTQSSKPTAPTRLKEDIARLGDEIYERDIRSNVEATQHGKIVAIDVDSGDYAIADTALAAADALRERHPALNVWAVRVGYPTLRTFGGSSLRMSLLDDHDLSIQVRNGGRVVIQATE